jgi:phenylpyruvate tautomerase PptA (4-oxalocrotonate tautomerase family)
MPMIDIYAPAGLFPAGSERKLAEELTGTLLRWEHAPATPAFLCNTGAYLHALPGEQVHTAADGQARTVRVQILTPPGVLDREAQRGLVRDVTEIVARISGDPGQAERTWVLLTEAAEGGWGVAGTALASEDLAALARGLPSARRSAVPRVRWPGGTASPTKGRTQRRGRRTR